MRYRIGELTLDTAKRTLTRASKPIRLAPKAYELFAHLVERWPFVVVVAEEERVTSPRILFEGHFDGHVRDLDVDANGDRILLLLSERPRPRTEIRVVEGLLTAKQVD